LQPLATKLLPLALAYATAMSSLVCPIPLHDLSWVCKAELCKIAGSSKADLPKSLKCPIGTIGRQSEGAGIAVHIRIGCNVLTVVQIPLSNLSCGTKSSHQPLIANLTLCSLT